MMKNTQANGNSGMFWSHAKHHTLNAKRFSLMQVQATGIDPFSTLPYQHPLQDDQQDDVTSSAVANDRSRNNITRQGPFNTKKSYRGATGLNDLLDEMDKVLVDIKSSSTTLPSAPSTEDTTTVQGGGFVFKNVPTLEPTPINPDSVHYDNNSSATAAGVQHLAQSLDKSSMDFFVKQLQQEDQVDSTMIDLGAADDILLEDLNESNATSLLDVDVSFNSDIFNPLPEEEEEKEDSDAKAEAQPQQAPSSSTVVSSSTAEPILSSEIQESLQPSTHSFFKPEQWEERYQELVEFRKKFGHCLVPHNWEPNRALAQWVKRQRYQYKLKMKNQEQDRLAALQQPQKWVMDKIHSSNSGFTSTVSSMKRSTLTNLRQRKLESIGFIWSTHNVLWEEKYVELKQYLNENGHCNVPSKFPSNPKLSVWVRCQRRQYKLLISKTKQQGSVSKAVTSKDCSSQSSSMTMERISKLKALGFNFNPRNLKV